MDYETKALFRNDIRRLALIFREIFGVKKEGLFQVLQALEKVLLVFEDCDYEIVENDILSVTTQARRKPNDKGGFTIEIRNEIYKGLYMSDKHSIQTLLLFMEEKRWKKM